MSQRVGLWLIGAHGGVSTTVAVGLAALQKEITDRCGLVSELPDFENLDLIDWPNIVLGGHDIRDTTCVAEAEKLSTGPTSAISHAIVSQCTEFLDEFDSNIRPGILFNCGETIEKLSSADRTQDSNTARDAVTAIQKDLQSFIERHNLDSLIMINAASTEPPFEHSVPETWAELEIELDSPNFSLPSSSIYAIASLDLGCAYVNFTPSFGSCATAIDELAKLRGTCHMGHDGKTGETFLKSVLAPAFANRNLNIMSWVGHNIFGNMDGQVLDDPINKKTKVTSKDQLLGQMLGYNPQTHISIEYIRSLGDWKTAWDHVHFKGFLGTPMILQFTWQGCDSILAAPLVLDLFRLTELAVRNGESGLMTHLASFFKSPIGTHENDFAKQFQMLTNWATKARETANA